MKGNEISKIILIIYVFSCPFFLIGQESRTQNKNDLRLGITELARGAIHLSYERSINNYRNGNLASYESTYVNKTNEEIIGSLFELQYRFYILRSDDADICKMKWNGIYVTPGIRYRDKKITDFYYHDQIQNLSFDLLIGIKYIFLKRIILDINCGGSIIHSEIKTLRSYHDYNSNLFSPGYSGIAPMANISFGFNF